MIHDTADCSGKGSECSSLGPCSQSGHLKGRKTTYLNTRLQKNIMRSAPELLAPLSKLGETKAMKNVFVVISVLSHTTEHMGET